MNNLKPSEQFVASFRGVGAVWRRVVYNDANKDNLPCTYRLADSESRENLQIYIESDGSGQLNFNIGVAVSDYKPHTEQIVCGRTLKTKYANASWIWIDGVPNPTNDGLATKVNVVWPDSLATVHACTFEFLGWRGGKYTRDDNNPKTVTFAQGGAHDGEATITVSDYYTVFYKTVEVVASGAVVPDNNFAASGVQISYTSRCSVLVHVPVQAAYANAVQYGPGCVRAASVRMTDMAAPLNIEGECSVSATRENGTWWEMFAVGAGGQGSVFKTNTAYRESYLGPLRLGGYAFHLPKDMDDYRRQPYLVVNYNTGAIIDVLYVDACELVCCRLGESVRLGKQRVCEAEHAIGLALTRTLRPTSFDLEDNSTVNVFTANTLNTGSNNGMTGQGADCWLTIATQWDGVTDNIDVTMYYPDVSFETWMHGLEATRNIPRVMSNKYHIKELMKSLFNKGLLAARKYAGPLIRVAGRSAAEYLAGQSPLAADGVRLLQQAYGVGDAIAGRLVNGH